LECLLLLPENEGCFTSFSLKTFFKNSFIYVPPYEQYLYLFEIVPRAFDNTQIDMPAVSARDQTQFEKVKRRQLPADTGNAPFENLMSEKSDCLVLSSKLSY
jgi:hypothetical protein